MDAKILILGITFKENCPDVRNTKVVDLISSIKEYCNNITIYDPWADKDEVKNEFGLDSVDRIPKGRFDAIVLTVAHNEFKNLNLRLLKNNKAIVYDVKNFFPEKMKDSSL